MTPIARPRPSLAPLPIVARTARLVTRLALQLGVRAVLLMTGLVFAAVTIALCPLLCARRPVRVA